MERALAIFEEEVREELPSGQSRPRSQSIAERKHRRRKRNVRVSFENKVFGEAKVTDETPGNAGLQHSAAWQEVQGDIEKLSVRARGVLDRMLDIEESQGRGRVVSLTPQQLTELRRIRKDKEDGLKWEMKVLSFKERKEVQRLVARVLQMDEADLSVQHDSLPRLHAARPSTPASSSVPSTPTSPLVRLPQEGMDRHDSQASLEDIERAVSEKLEAEKIEKEKVQEEEIRRKKQVEDNQKRCVR